MLRQKDSYIPFDIFQRKICEPGTKTATPFSSFVAVRENEAMSFFVRSARLRHVYLNKNLSLHLDRNPEKNKIKTSFGA